MLFVGLGFSPPLSLYLPLALSFFVQYLVIIVCRADACRHAQLSEAKRPVTSHQSALSLSPSHSHVGTKKGEGIRPGTGSAGERSSTGKNEGALAADQRPGRRRSTMRERPKTKAKEKREKRKESRRGTRKSQDVKGVSVRRDTGSRVSHSHHSSPFMPGRAGWEVTKVSRRGAAPPSFC